MKKHYSLIFFLCSLFFIFFSASCNHSDDQQVIDPPPTAAPEPSPTDPVPPTGQEPPTDQESPPISEDTTEPVIRVVTIDMFDSYGDGWNSNGALIIKINGIEIANNVKVHTTPADQRRANTYTFNATTGDVVELYWVAGTKQKENSFIVYYTDTPPIPAFNENSNLYWDGSNALFFQLRSTMDTIANGELLGSFTIKQ